MRDYKHLVVWQRANELAHEIYNATEDFPREHAYGLTGQLQRAALSVPTNIAEGSYSAHNREFHQFLNIAFRSLGETSYLVEFAKQRKLLSESEYDKIHSLLHETERMLGSLLASVRSRQ